MIKGPLIICPKCKELGEIGNKITSYGSISTLMGYIGFYDDNNNYHLHDRNTVTTTYVCMRGHKFIGIQKGTSCPSFPENCDFDGGPIRFIAKNPPLNKG